MWTTALESQQPVERDVVRQDQAKLDTVRQDTEKEGLAERLSCWLTTALIKLSEKEALVKLGLLQKESARMASLRRSLPRRESARVESKTDDLDE